MSLVTELAPNVFCVRSELANFGNGIFYKRCLYSLHYPYGKEIRNNGSKKRARCRPKGTARLTPDESSLRDWLVAQRLEHIEHIMRLFASHIELGNSYKRDIENLRHMKTVDFRSSCEMSRIMRKFSLDKKDEVHDCKNFENVGDLMDLFNVVVKNYTNFSQTISLEGQKFLIPQGSIFMMSDISDSNILLKQLKFKYDLILMDPPWGSKSVSRSNSYEVIDMYKIFELNAINYLNECGYLAIWIVNREKVINFVLDKLLPDSKLYLVEKWFWVKTTSSGEFAIDPYSTHKRPYEVMLLARKSKKHHARMCLPVRYRTIFGMPSYIHSKKIMINKMLESYVSKNSKKLELFARNLFPNWISWGNEVLSLCDQRYFMNYAELL